MHHLGSGGGGEFGEGPARDAAHLVADGETSWHGFAEAIVDEAHALGLIARKPRVTAIGTTDYPTPAQRPAYSVLDTTKLRTDFGIAPPGWREGLRRTLGEPR